LEGRWHGNASRRRTEEGGLQGDVQGGGQHLSQNLLCTGHDYSINASLKLINMDGKIKGSWSESTYDANGAVTDTAKDNIIHARITGDKFSGRMSINVSGARHSINTLQLNPKSGTYRLAASLSMGR
jgi:hypothetical protein